MDFQDVQLFVKNPDDPSSSNFGVGLDLFISSPIKITKSIQSLDEPTATTSSYSQTFRVPNTPSNARFFKAVFNVNSVTFNAAKKVPAYINVNGAFFIEGNVTLNNVIYAPDQEKIEYELIFLGETSNFGSAVAAKDMSTIDLSDLSHPLNYSNIQLSWNRNLMQGNVVYPLAEYGYTYDETTKQPNIPTLAVYNSSSGVKGFTNSINPLKQTQFKPIVKLKYIWDKIFSQAGFTYTSNFLNSSPLFTNMFLVSSDVGTSGAEIPEKPLLSTAMSGWSNYLYTTNQDIKLFYPNETIDTTNNWDALESKYTAVAPGGTGASSAAYNYTFNISNMTVYGSFPAVAGAPPDAYFRRFTVKLKYTVGGTQYTSSKTAYAYLGTSGSINNAVAIVYASSSFDPNFTWTISLPHRATVEFYANLDFAEASAGLVIVGSALGAEGPNVVDPTGMLPKQFKQIDFIKGINDRFKLMWEPDPDNPKNFFIEPWVDWIKTGQERDWTAKLDRNSDVTVTPLFQTQPREIIFSDTEEADLYNFSYQQENKETFGQLNQDSGLEVITGERQIKSPFSPVPLGPIGNSNQFIIPHFAKDTETERQPIQIKPRLVFYNGLVTAPNTWYMKNDAGSAVAQTTYPLISQFSGYPFNQSVMDLNWTNVKQFWTANSNNTGTGRTPLTAYSNYWQRWFNFTYSPYGRVMEATFNLNISDLRTLKFSDKIFVKDSWWLPIEVKDYSLNQADQNVKVKLVKLGDDVGVSVGAATTNLFLHSGIIFSTTACGACCVGDSLFRTITVYTNDPIFSQSSVIFLNPEGTLIATEGSYSNGIEALTVSASGAVTSVTLCSLCICSGGGLTAYSVCNSTSVCGACCCSSFSQTIYGNALTLAGATQLYGDSSGTTSLIPYRWYRNASAVAQVGADGTTIISFGTCSGCYCPETPPGE